MAEKSFPLEGTVYTAEDAALWFATRIGGVYAEGDLAVYEGTGLKVNVRPGMAWLNLSKYSGVAYANTAVKSITLTPAHANFPRIDRVLIRYSKAENKVRLVVETGTPAASPSAPLVNRPGGLAESAEVSELSLAQVYVAAGATQITPANITDERLDPSVCGIMSDGVTSIDTTMLASEASGKITELIDEASHEFYTWFESIRGSLDENAVGNLQNQINDINNGLGMAGIRPNLLDNWYFVGSGTGNTFPIHQRGGSYSGYGYGVDKWLNYSPDITVQPMGNHLKLTCTARPNGYPTFLQYIENASRFNGRKITFSVLIKRTTTQTFNIALKDRAIGGNGFCSASATKPVGEWDLITCTGIAYDNLSSLQATMIFITPSSNDEVHIKAAKVELGDTQTLAHKDANGVWQLNEAVDYAEQLTRCQRYFIRYQGNRETYNMPFIGMDANSNVIYFTLQFPTPMRRTPSVAYSDLSHFKAYNAKAGELSVSSIAIHSHDNNPAGVSWVSLAVTCDGLDTTTMKGSPFLLRMTSDAILDFVADL